MLSEKHKWFNKVISILCGISLIILGVINFLNLNIASPIDIIMPVYYV